MMIWKYLLRLRMWKLWSQNIVPDVVTHGHRASLPDLRVRRDRPSRRALRVHHVPENHDCRHHTLRHRRSRPVDGLQEAAPRADGRC